jgi:peptidoglycan/LPS O-acetylase OafA/YrhL
LQSRFVHHNDGDFGRAVDAIAIPRSTRRHSSPLQRIDSMTATQPASILSESNTEGEKSRSKILGLECIRFVSALAILVWHYKHFSYLGSEPVEFSPSTQPLYSLLLPIYRYGYLGVQIFWCISGYIFFWKYGEAIATGSISGWNFFVYRLSRLYPLHFVTLLAVALLQYAYFRKSGVYFVYQNNNFREFFLQIFMASSWIGTAPVGFNGPIWSISVEILIYFIFYAFLRIFLNNIFLSGMVVVATAVAMGFGVSSPVLQCLALFYAGGVLTMAAPFMRRHRTAAGASFLLVIAMIAGWHFLNSRPELEIQPKFFLMAATLSCVYFMSEYFNPPARIRGAIETAGNMTYSSYLLHFPIQLCIMLVCRETGVAVPYRSVWFFLGFIAVTLVSSKYAFSMIERPAQAFIRRRLASHRRIKLMQAEDAPI